MENIADYIKKVAMVYYSIGSVLLIVGINSLGPVLVEPLFSEATVNAFLEVVGALGIFIGYLKSTVIVKDDPAMMKKSIDNSFAINPFKFSV